MSASPAQGDLFGGAEAAAEMVATLDHASADGRLRTLAGRGYVLLVALRRDGTPKGAGLRLSLVEAGALAAALGAARSRAIALGEGR